MFPKRLKIVFKYSNLFAFSHLMHIFALSVRTQNFYLVHNNNEQKFVEKINHTRSYLLRKETWFSLKIQSTKFYVYTKNFSISYWKLWSIYMSLFIISCMTQKISTQLFFLYHLNDSYFIMLFNS